MGRGSLVRPWNTKSNSMCILYPIMTSPNDCPCTGTKSEVDCHTYSSLGPIDSTYWLSCEGTQRTISTIEKKSDFGAAMAEMQESSGKNQNITRHFRLHLTPMLFFRLANICKSSSFYCRLRTHFNFTSLSSWCRPCSRKILAVIERHDLSKDIKPRSSDIFNRSLQSSLLTTNQIAIIQYLNFWICNMGPMFTLWCSDLIFYQSIWTWSEAWFPISATVVSQWNMRDLYETYHVHGTVME